MTDEPLAPDEIGAILNKSFGSTGTVSRLPGEHDENYLVQNKGQRLVLRIFAAGEDEQRINFILKILTHLSTTGGQTSKLIPAQGGAYLIKIIRKTGAIRFACLMTFVMGDTLGMHVHSKRVAATFGRALATLDLNLADVKTSLEYGSTPWDLTRPWQAKELFASTVLGDHDSLTRSELERYESEVLPEVQRLPTQVIHNDANLDNVIIEKGSENINFIDFGDAIRAPRVIELAVAASYFDPGPIVLDTGSPFDDLISAYNQVQDLEREEIRLLKYCISARLALAIGMATHRSITFPDRAAYVLRHIQGALSRLDAMNAMSEGSFMLRVERFKEST